MIPETQIKQIRKELENCKRPIFFFHDDPDGLCSFLLLYRFVNKGKGIPVRTNPRITEDFFAKKATDYGADKVFILDIAMVDQEFVDAVAVPVVWIDHHAPLKINNVKYFNPRIDSPDEYSPVSYWCYKVVEQDLWISVVGCIGDKYYPSDIMPKFREQYKDLMPRKTRDFEYILYDTLLGELVRIFSFSLKGKTKEIDNCTKILTRIEGPKEILEGTSSQGRYLYKHFEMVNKPYQKTLKRALDVKPQDGMIVFIYRADKISVTKDIANELSHRLKGKIIAIGREKGDKIIFSLRHNRNLLPSLENALKLVNGIGGGHKFACGATVKRTDVEIFLKTLRDGLKAK